MKNKKKIFVQVVFGLFITTVLCSFTANSQITPREDIPEGYSLIDGDILMPTWFVDAVLQGRMPEAAYRTNLWTNGVIPFEFHDNVTVVNQVDMIFAMQVLETFANVDFFQCGGNNCPDPSNYVNIRASTGNSSAVGMIGGPQPINIVSWNSRFTIVHELLHTLGFYHEHQRPDRNTFITVTCGNVQGGCNGPIFPVNFNIPNDASRYGTYDFDSLTHYGRCDFSIDCPAGQTCSCTNTVFTIEGTVPAGVTVGQRTHLSVLDQATVSFLYPFPNWRFLDCTYNGSNGSPIGTFPRPYTTLAAALANTPTDGTVWVLNNCSFSVPFGPYSNRVTIRAATTF